MIKIDSKEGIKLFISSWKKIRSELKRKENQIKIKGLLKKYFSSNISNITFWEFSKEF